MSLLLGDSTNSMLMYLKLRRLRRELYVRLVVDEVVVGGSGAEVHRVGQGVVRG